MKWWANFQVLVIAVGSPTVGHGILSSMAGFLEFLKQLKFKNKKAAAFGCYGWSGESVNILKEKLKEAGFLVSDENVLSLWNPDEKDFENVKRLVNALV